MYKIFLILRYLCKKTLIMLSMGGVTVAVMVFIVVFSVLDGFGQNIERRLRGTISDIVVEDTSGWGLTDYESIMRDAQNANAHIVACAPYIERIAMFQKYVADKKVQDNGRITDVAVRASRTDYGIVRGIDPARELRVGRLDEFLRAKDCFYAQNPGVPLTVALRPGLMNILVGEGARAPGSEYAADRAYTFENPADGSRFAGVGLTLEERLASLEREYGTRDFLITERGVAIYSAVSGRPQTVSSSRFHVVGTFKTWNYEYDARYAYMNITDAQKLLQMGKPYVDRPTGETAWKPSVTGISVRLDSYDNLAGAKKTLDDVLKKYGATSTVKGWTEIQHTMLDALVIEKAVAVTILTCIVIVMGFGIFSILSISSGQKARDIGVLKAIGATDRGILAIFLATGLSIGIVGSVVGSALGILVEFIRSLTGWELFPKDVFYFDKIPSQIHPGVYVAIAGITLAVCLVASIVPALMAARRDPTKTLVG